MADLSRDMLAGAQLVNMGWQRQERMMQLRALQAKQQMDERQTAAQVEMLLAHRDLYRQQVEQKLTDEADMLSYQNMVNEDINVNEKDPLQASVERLVPLSRANPALAERIGKSIEQQVILKNLGPKMQADLEAREASRQADLARADYWKSRAAQPGGGASGGAGVSPMRRYANELSAALDTLESAQESGNPDAIAKAQEDLDNLKSAMNKLHPDRAQTIKGQMLKARVDVAFKALAEYPKDEALKKLHDDAVIEFENYISGKDTSKDKSTPAPKISGVNSYNYNRVTRRLEQ